MWQKGFAGSHSSAGLLLDVGKMEPLFCSYTIEGPALTSPLLMGSGMEGSKGTCPPKAHAPLPIHALSTLGPWNSCSGSHEAASRVYARHSLGSVLWRGGQFCAMHAIRAGAVSVCPQSRLQISRTSDSG